MSPEQEMLGGRYRVFRWLRQDDGARTCVALDQQDSNQVVVKILAGPSLSSSVRHRMVHDAEILRGLDSAHLAPLVRLESCDGQIYLISPLMEGIPLERRLARGPLSVPEAIRIGRCLLRALSTAHEQGVLHRNIKPANVILDESQPIESAILIDFGHCPVDWREPSVREAFLKTVHYLSPEQAGLLKGKVDQRSDLYAMGLLLFECLAGRSPFLGDSVGELLLQHLNVEPPSLRGLGIPLPRALDEMIGHLLHKQPRDRYQAAVSALKDLEAIEQALQGGQNEPELVIGLGDQRRVLTEPAFVARSAEMGALEGALSGACEGKGGLVLLEGVSGSGKTRVLDEWAQRAAQMGAWVLRGQSSESPGQRPFELFEGLARDLSARMRADEELFHRIRIGLKNMKEVICTALPQLAEILDQKTGGVLGPEEHGEKRTQLALTMLLDALGTPATPAVLLLDDCQWADDMTLKVLSSWQRRNQQRGSSCHLLLVSAFRSEEVVGDHPLRSLDPVFTIELGPLAGTELRQLLESMAGSLPEQVVSTVYQLSEGNPLMATSILWGLVESRAMVGESEGWRVSSDELERAQSSLKMAAILIRRLEYLSEPVKELLAAAAVVGRDFEFDQIVSLTRQSHRHVLDCLQEACNRHLLWADASGARWHFVHDKLRESLLDSLAEQQRRELHLVIARQLSARGNGHQFQIAYHFDAAQESSLALHHALEAGKTAREQYALEIAERQYRIADRGAQAANEQTRLRIAESLGEVLMLRNHHDEAQEQLHRALSLCNATVSRARIQGRLGQLAFRRGDNRVAGEAIAEALRLLDQPVPQSSPALARHAARDLTGYMKQRLRPRRDGGDLEPTERERLTIHLYSQLPSIWWFIRGSLPALWSHLHRLNLAEKLSPCPELGLAYSFHGRVLASIGKFDRGIEFADKGLAICKEIGDLWGQGYALYVWGGVLYVASRFDEAYEKLEQSIPLLEQAGDFWQALASQGVIGCIQLRQGKLRQALASGIRVYEAGLEYDQGLPSSGGLDVWTKVTGGQIPAQVIHSELMRAGDDVLWKSMIQQAEGIRLLREDEPRAAAAMLDEAWRTASENGFKREMVFPALGWLVTALRLCAAKEKLASSERKQLLDRANSVVRQGRRVTKRFKNHLPHLLREHGLLAAAEGQLSRARRSLDESLAVAEEQGARWDWAQTLLARGRIGMAVGWERAVHDDRTARQALREMGADFALGEVLAHEALQELDETPAVTLSLADRFDRVLELGRRIATSLSFEEVFDQARQAALKLIRGDECLILEVLDETGRSRCVYPEGIQREVSAPLVQRSLDAGRPVVVAVERELEPGDDLILSGVRSALAAPIYIRGVACFCLYVTHRIVGDLFGEEEERLAGFIATVAGAAMENAQNYTELERAFRELKSTQAQLVQAGKLAALGQLGAGLAHELNQPIQSIQGFAQRIRRNTAAPIVEHADELDIIINASHRMAAIVQNIRTFSRDESFSLAPLEPMEPVEQALALVGRQLEKMGIEVSWVRPDHSLPRVSGDRNKLQQVYLNLIMNARDALVEMQGSRAKCILLGAALVDGRVIVRVQDTGPGVEPDLENRIFDPFFTTKTAGQGTGLGLSISYGIVKEHQGELRYESAPGGGAIFSVALPVSPES